MGTLYSTTKKLSGGVAPVTGVGRSYTLKVTGTWAADDTFLVTLAEELSGRRTQVGYGALGGASPAFLKTFKKKLYLSSGTNLFFSALEQPTVYNDLNGAGNSVIELANELGFADDIVAVALYRRYLAVFGRRHVQIWAMDPDPANNQNIQTLENAGTVNGGSVQSIGTLDVLHCADSGVRSLAARANSEDALVTDLGSPVDSLVQAAMASAGTDGICSVVEPRTNRYWLAIGSTIFVFTYFPSSGIAAWSTYTARTELGYKLTITGGTNGTISVTGYVDDGRVLPLANAVAWDTNAETTAAAVRAAMEAADMDAMGSSAINQTFAVSGAEVAVTGPANLVDYLGNTTVTVTGDIEYTLETVFETFTPKHFALFGNQLFVRGTNNQIYQYGGADGNTYDAAPCTWETPWLDAKAPATQKWFSGVDAGMEGGWVVKAGASPKAGSASLREVYRHDESSFDLGRIGAGARGHFFKLRGETTGAEYARFGLVAKHMEKADAT